MPAMRTRNLGALTNYEVEEYLKHNDIIFIPVGTLEMHGPMPMDCEYVLPEAVCYQLAEVCDGLVLPHVAYLHPGATDIGRGTIYMSITDGYQYLRSIAQTLLNQGFRRQVYLSAHGPAFMTVLPMITQFLDETKVPLFYSDVFTLLNESEVPPSHDNIGKMFFGSYKLMNRLQDVPVNLNLPEIVITEGSDMSHFLPESMQCLFPKNGGYFTAFKYGNPLEHGGQEYSPKSAEELEDLATQGADLIRKFARTLPFQEKLDALRELDLFQQLEILPRYGEWMVRNRYPKPGN